MSDFERIYKKAESKALEIITTEKDYMKIPEIFRKQIDFVSIDLIIQNERELIKLLTK